MKKCANKIDGKINSHKKNNNNNKYGSKRQSIENNLLPFNIIIIIT